MFMKHLTLGAMDNNCYIIADETTREAAVIDAPYNAPAILAALEKENLTCKYILLTHSHFDHVGALEDLRSATGAKVAIHADEQSLLTDSTLSIYERFGIQQPPISPDLLLQDGEVLTLGGIDIIVHHTPGHTPGGACYYAGGLLFSGDTLFSYDIGRCDLPGGHYKTILQSIRQKLYTLPDETPVYPGHGASTTIGSEKQHNNYIRQGWEYEY